MTGHGSGREAARPASVAGSDQDGEFTPAFAVGTLGDMLTAEGTAIGDACVAVLGLTREREVCTRAREVVGVLSTLGAEVWGVDPSLSWVDAEAIGASAVRPGRIPDLAPELDAAVVVVDHPEFERVRWNRLDRLVVLDLTGTVDPASVDQRVCSIDVREGLLRRESGRWPEVGHF